MGRDRRRLWWCFGGCGSSVKRQFLSRASAGAAGVLLAAITSLAMTGNALAENASDDSFSALRAYVQSSDETVRTPTSDTTTQATQQNDAVYAALRDFALKVADEPSPLAKGATKLAADEPETLLDWMTRHSSPQTPAVTMPETPAAKPAGPPVAAHYIGSQACATCHSPLIAEFKKTLMGKISMTAKGKGKFECENCHGPGSAHVAAGGGRGVGGIMSFGNDDPRSADEKNAVCLACHQRGERTYWPGSVHQTRGLACTNCHTVMKAVSRKHNLKTTVEAETCFQCHSLKRAQMQYSSHMPIREGKITCSNCHNPHGSTTEKLIRQATINDNCYTCHADKRGPFLWEHAPVRENCLNCHKPHGSNYEYLLQVARPRLCANCHSSMHGTQGIALPNVAYMLGRGCGNCHSNIHGSNDPNGVYFLR
jgi:DmsE family decaheme c-type cytochrome